MFSKLMTVAACVAASSAAWNYDRCEVALGPDSWSTTGSCGGSQQSPINICGAVPIPRRAQTADNKNSMRDYTMYASSYNRPHAVTVQNTGHSFQLAEGAPVPVLRIPNLHNLVGRSAPAGVANPEWTFAQMHVHFGREQQANEGSEHTVNGRRYPAELHLVHYNKARGANLTAALATGARDAVLVVGVLYELGDVESKLIKQLADVAPGTAPPPTNPTAPVPVPVVLSDVFTPSDSFYSYAGSLTTPGCNEQVTWVVMKTPKTITAESLERFKTVMENVHETISHMGNYLPVQALNDRTIYSSSLPRNAVPTPCQPFPIPEPCYTCAPHARREASEPVLSLDTQASMSIWMWVAGAAIPSTMAIIGAMAYYFSRKAQRVEVGAAAHVELVEVE